MTLTHRTFDELRGTCAWVDTLAYWLGVTCKSSFKSETLLELVSSMAYQYDVEEQADCFGAPFPEDAEWRRFFKPIAPVQLAFRWSPLVETEPVLGEPAVAIMEQEEFSGCHGVTAFWTPQQVADAKAPSSAGTADEKRFFGLLAVAVGRAQPKGAGLLLVAKPGWSYNSVRAVSAESAALMKQHGLVVTDRRPGLANRSA